MLKQQCYRPIGYELPCHRQQMLHKVIINNWYEYVTKTGNWLFLLQ